MDNVFIRKAIPGDEQALAYIQTESWKAAFAGILSPEELVHTLGYFFTTEGL